MVVIYHFGCISFKSFVFVVCLYHQLEISLTRQFSGHTNDRNQVNYANVSGYEYYVLWN